MKKKQNKDIKTKEKKTFVDVVGYTPKPWQKVVHLLLYKHQKNCTIVVKSKRQCGKSTMLENILLERAITKEGTTSMLISPTFAQARKVYKDIIGAIGHTILISSKNETNLEINFINGSKILFRSAESKENLRGYSVNGVLCVDEAAYISNDVYAIFLPFISVAKAPLVLCSTPRYKSGMYYKYWEMGNDDKQPLIHAIDFNDFDTSEMIDENQLKQIKQTIPHTQFLNEYMGEFSSLDSDLFGNVADVINDTPEKNNTYYMGVDWATGSGGDYTAVAMFNSLHEMVFLDRWNNLDETATINKITDIVEEWQPRVITVEKNSIGSVFFGLLQKKLKDVGSTALLKAFTTTNESKNKIINNFQLAIQNKQLSLISNQFLLQEMATYKAELTPTGKTTYNATNGCHDDCLIATMIAYASLNRTNNYNIII